MQVVDKAARPRALLRTLEEAGELEKSGRLDEAERLLLRLHRNQPRDALPAFRLAEFHTRRGDHVAAAESYLRLAQREPGNVLAWRNAGICRISTGDPAGAITCLEKAIAMEPTHSPTRRALGKALMQQGRLVEAVPHFREAMMLAPQDADAYFALGVLFGQLGECGLARVTLEAAVLIRPDFARARYHLAAIHTRQDDLAQAKTMAESAVALDPGSPDAHNTLGNVNLRLGALDVAQSSFARALDLGGSVEKYGSNFLFCLQLDSRVDSRTLFEAHREIARRIESPVLLSRRPHGNHADPARRLRIGYVSADFRKHAVANFILPVFRHHDRAQVEVFAYYSHVREDDTSRQISGIVDHWMPCAMTSDDSLAERIRADGIDILVDLSGHTANNRLAVFARKPAPVQATWIGYLGTTGLEAMDYRITDAHLDPPGIADGTHTEKLVRLPGCNVPFQPPPEAPPVNALPALGAERITFGCLNNPQKVGPAVVALWSRLLQARPDSRLVLGYAKDVSLRERFLADFTREGIEPSRIEFRPCLPMSGYLALHHEIDFALDPFPYSGGTTSCHALWMGVPFVTLPGERTVSRCGSTTLARVGLEHFIARDEDDYVAIAMAAVADLPALDVLRQGLRERIAARETCDPATITRHLENAYRDMWTTWCDRAAAR